MIKKYQKQIIIGVVILVFLLIVRTVLKKGNQNVKSLSAVHAARADALGLDINELWADTETIYTELGIDMFWHDSWFPFRIPAPWENETGVIRAVNKYSSLDDFNLLADIYDARFKRSLRVDLRKYLSPSQQAQIPQL